MKRYALHASYLSLLLLSMVLLTWPSHAQQRQALNEQMRAITAKESNPGLLYFRPELNLDAKNIFATQKSAFTLSTQDQMHINKVDTCSLGDIHYEFQQSYKGIPVDGAYFIIHERAGKAESGNGRIVSNLDISVNPQVSEAAALQAVLSDFGATTYQWEVPSMEVWIKDVKGDPNATFYPQGKLVIFNPYQDNDPSHYRLAWEFLVSSYTPFNSRIYYVDAANGNVLKWFRRITNTSATGQAATVYSGLRTIVTDYIGFFNKTYRLLDNSRGAGITTWNIRNYDKIDSAVHFTDADNFWNNVNPQKDQYATDAHWGVAVTYDYFNAVHAHRGIDGTATKALRSYVHWGGTYANNAFYWSGGGDIFGFGDGNGTTTNPKVSLDIVAHEFTHGVTKHVVSPPHGLEYQDEPGQLNEAYSDIFGVLVEYWIKGNNPGLWLFGEDIWISPNHTRNIPNPKLKNQPSTYKKAPWYFGAGDYGGVHYNNSVGTLWFYYLALGGSGKNDNGDEFNVKGIGLAKAEKIAWRTLSHYHTRYDQYANARELSYKAAMDLFGTTKPVDSCCFEARQVLNAWHAVGVGDPVLMFEKAEIEPADCDSANGEATIFVKGVKGTPKYAWSNGDTTAKADSLAPGDYTVTVTDTSTGCKIDTTITIKENANFWMSAMGSIITECGKDDGWAQVWAVPKKGTPEILWSTGATTDKIENLKPGDYSVTVTDTSTNCKRDTTVTVEEWGPEVQVVGGGNRTICKGQPMPTFTLSAITKFCANCDYTWSTGAKTKSITVSNPGAYSVTARTGACSASAGTTVTVWIRDCDSTDEWEVPIIAAYDPNDIAGPEGYGEPRFINNTTPMHYLVRFENDPDFATAAARKVTVVVPLDPNTTIYSFKLGDFGFGDFIFSVPENTAFYTNRLDVSDSLGVAVDVTAGIDVVKRELFWIFNSVDPLTGLEPADATLGFLLVNDSITHRGEGFVNFSIEQTPGLTTGDTIAKQAVIVFDINEEIPTNIWKNTLDALPPTSKVDSLPAHSGSTTIPVTFSGQDDTDGSGIASYALYFSKDNGPFTFYREFPSDTNAFFTGDAEAEYRFFSIATDNVGNVEAMKQSPEATTTLHGEPVYYWNTSGNYRYANTEGTLLPGVILQVYDTAQDLLASDTSSATAEYSLPELREGDYDFVSHYAEPWGGGNAIDALLIMKHFAGMDSLTGVRAVAADVNASGFINATDAQQVASRFVNVIDSFAAGDWCFHPGSVMLDRDTYLLIQGLCVGDVNGSHIPGLKVSPSLGLATDQTIFVTQEVVYTLPVRLNLPMNLNAASIVLHYPAHQIEILGIEMPGTTRQDLFWSNRDGSLRLAWFSLNSREITTNEVLMYITIRLQPYAKPGDILFTLDASSQLGDPDARVIQHASLLIPKLVVQEQISQHNLQAYPNPFHDQTEIRFELPEAARVFLSIYDAGGKLIAILKEGELPQGSHQVSWKASDIASGVYICQLEIRTQASQQLISRRILFSGQDGRP